MKPSVWCFAVDPGYLARRSHGTISCDSKAWSPSLGSATIYTGETKQSETENQLAVHVLPQSRMSCWGERSVLIYFIVLDIKPYLTLSSLFPFFVPSQLCCWGLGATAF